MGDWNTIHLFNTEIFHEEVIPKLKGTKGNLENDYLQYLKLGGITGGIDRLKKEQLNELIKTGVQEIISISKQFDERLEYHSIFNQLPDDQSKKEYIEKNDFYNFNRFFEFIIFYNCADYYPYFISGKHPIYCKVEFKHNSISHEILSILNYGINKHSYSLYNTYNMGIRGWISNTDVELLILDFNHLIKEDIKWNHFKDFLYLAKHRNFGLVAGVNMRNSILELSHQNKLMSLSELLQLKSYKNVVITES